MTFCEIPGKNNNDENMHCDECETVENEALSQQDSESNADESVSADAEMPAKAMDSVEKPVVRPKIKYLETWPTEPVDYNIRMELQSKRGPIFAIVFGGILIGVSQIKMLYSSSKGGCDVSSRTTLVFSLIFLLTGLLSLFIGIHKLKKVRMHNTRVRYESKRNRMQ